LLLYRFWDAPKYENKSVVEKRNVAWSWIASSHTQTPAGMLMGAVESMAPEQIEDEPLDGRADRFSLAVMVFQLFTGQRIYTTDSFVAMSFKIVNDPPPLPSLVNARLPAQVDGVFLRALAKFPADRYPACLDFIAALRAEWGSAPPFMQKPRAEAHPTTGRR
jgi:hypothetical protein